MKALRGVLIWIALCTLGLSAEVTNRDDLDWRLGFNLTYSYHNAGNAKSANSSMPAVAFYYYNKWRFLNRFFLSDELNLGANASNTKNYHLAGSENLTSYKPRGGLILNIDGNILLGYSVIKREYDAPLKLAIGYRFKSFASVSGMYPLLPQSMGHFVQLEASGLLEYAPKVDIEYAVSFDYLVYGNMLVSSVQEDSTVSNYNLKINSGYGLSLMLGARYYVSNKAYFFAQLIASYTRLGKSNTMSYTSPANPYHNITLANTTTDIYYPVSHTGYVGIRLGYGF